MPNNPKRCPHCGQLMAVYRRNIRANMVHCLRLLHFQHKGAYVKANGITPVTRVISDFPKLRFWGLIERHPDLELWRITGLGVDFILGRIRVKKYIWVYDNMVQPDPVGEPNPLISAMEIDPEFYCKVKALAEARQPDMFPKAQNV
jgi:hypothetical protein